VDKEVRYQATVEYYQKWRGYGWLKLAQTGILPEDKVFVHHKSLQSDDRFPFLVKDMQVEIGLHPYSSKKTPGKIYVRAKAVTLPGGARIAVQDEMDAEKKQFVGGQHLRYSGKLQWYSVQRDFGYVTMDDGFVMDEAVPKSIKVEVSEVNSGGKPIPTKMKDVQVEFGIVKTRKGEFRCYNMTLPGGEAIAKEVLEKRETAGPRLYKGTVEVNMWKQGYGFIKVAPGAPLPPKVTAKLAQAKKAKEANGKGKGKQAQESLLYFRNSDIRDNQWLRKGQEVQFKVYTDDNGAGAMDIHGEDAGKGKGR